MDALRKEEYYTYTDYAAWDTDERYELIDGVPFMMAVPSRVHQDILLEIGGQFRNFLRGKSCRVYIAPFDVRLNFDTRDDTVVQPDVLVICDLSKLDDKGLKGAPDLVIEILSPTNQNHDRLVKFNKYLEHGVREYWIVDPEEKSVFSHVLENGKYVTSAFGENESVPVHVLGGCVISLTDVFAAAVLDVQE